MGIEGIDALLFVQRGIEAGLGLTKVDSERKTESKTKEIIYEEQSRLKVSGGGGNL